jgi:hypothetical protein
MKSDGIIRNPATVYGVNVFVSGMILEERRHRTSSLQGPEAKAAS